MSTKPLSFYGSISYTDLKEALKNPKLAAKKVKTKSGDKIMIDVVIWVKEEADQFNQNASMQLSFKKGFQDDTESRPYVGNFRYMTPKEKDLTPDEMSQLANEEDDLPY